MTAAIALRLSQDRKVGLIDMDFFNSSLGIALGLEKLPEFKEENGIKPGEVNPNLYVISLEHFAGDRPLALRGEEVTDALIELLAITRWEGFDHILGDTPPGMGDTLLNVINFFPEDTNLVVITTPDQLSVNSVSKLLQLLNELSPTLRKAEILLVINKAEPQGYEGELLKRFPQLIREVFYIPELNGSPREITEKIADLLPEELLHLLEQQ